MQGSKDLNFFFFVDHELNGVNYQNQFGNLNATKNILLHQRLKGSRESCLVQVGTVISHLQRYFKHSFSWWLFFRFVSTPLQFWESKWMSKWNKLFLKSQSREREGIRTNCVDPRNSWKNKSKIPWSFHWPAIKRTYYLNLQQKYILRIL